MFVVNNVVVHLEGVRIFCRSRNVIGAPERSTVHSVTLSEDSEPAYIMPFRTSCVASYLSDPCPVFALSDRVNILQRNIYCCSVS